MLEEDKEDYEALCETFYASVNPDRATEIYVAGLVENSPNELNEEICEASEELTWQTIPINLAELEKAAEKPAEDLYQPSPIWERPAGHSTLGVKPFKV
jgi:hypothetical protein